MREVGDSNNAIVQSLYEGDWSFIVYEHYVSAMQIVIFLFLTMGLVFGRKEIIEHVVLLLPCLFLIGGYLYHLISETRGVYVYYYVWMLMPIAATGFYRTENCVKALFASGPVFVTDTNEDPETSEPRK